MAEQKFKLGDRVKITDFTGTIVGTKLEDNSIKHHVKVDQGRIYTWVFQNSLEHMDSAADNFKQTITVETERKTGETIIRISNPKFTTDEPTADVQEVKRGYWKFNQHSKVVASFRCSECQTPFYNFGNSKILSPTPYCPNCGARMDGDSNDG